MDHALSLVEVGNRDSEEPALTFRSCQQPPSLSAAPVPDRQLLLHFEWERGVSWERSAMSQETAGRNIREM